MTNALKAGIVQKLYDEIVARVSAQTQSTSMQTWFATYAWERAAIESIMQKHTNKYLTYYQRISKKLLCRLIEVHSNNATPVTHNRKYYYEQNYILANKKNIIEIFTDSFVEYGGISKTNYKIQMFFMFILAKLTKVWMTTHT